MENAIARTKNVRISPKKARLAAALIRNIDAQKAVVQLRFSKLKASRLLKKTLDSAIANAKVKFAASAEELKVKVVKIDEGPVMKRRRSRNKGGMSSMLRRTSHFTIVLEMIK